MRIRWSPQGKVACTELFCTDVAFLAGVVCFFVGCSEILGIISELDSFSYQQTYHHFIAEIHTKKTKPSALM